jgi:hypothetical protein
VIRGIKGRKTPWHLLQIGSIGSTSSLHKQVGEGDLKRTAGVGAVDGDWSDMLGFWL